MSESLFNTKCKGNDECTSVFFWPGVSCFLLLYLLFFLYHEEITRFVRDGLSLKLPIVSKIMNNRNTQDSAEDLSCMDHRLNGHSKGSGFLKMIFYYYPILHLFRNSVGVHREQQIIGDLETRFLRAFNFIVINTPFFGCPSENVRPVEKTFILCSVSYCLLALVSFLNNIFTKVVKIAKKFIISQNEIHRSMQDAYALELLEISAYGLPQLSLISLSWCTLLQLKFVYLCFMLEWEISKFCLLMVT